MAQLNQPVILGYSSGKTVWFVAFRQSDFFVLNPTSKTWVTFVLGNLSQYVMTMTEIASTGIYVGYYPADFLLDVLPLEAFYQQSGMTPALPADLPMITTGQSQGESLAAIAYDVVAASNLQKNTASQTQGIVQSGAPTMSSIPTNLPGPDNIYNGRVIIFTSGGQNKAAAIVTGFSSGSGLLTFTPIASAPSVGDAFLIA